MYKSFALLLLAFAPFVDAVEVFEAGAGRETELPGGKEADGIRGDFVLRSDTVEAVISHNAHNRRANMSTFYGEDGVSPGCLYDLTLRGANNDQLVVYGPAGHGAVSYVRIVEGAKAGEAAVESVTTAAKNGGIYKRNEYRLKDGVQGVFITTTLRNESDKAQKVNTKSDLARFNSQGTTVDGIFWMDAINPAHKCGYALASLRVKGTDKTGDEIELTPGQEVVKERFFAVGRSPAEAVGEALEVKGIQVTPVSGKLRNTDGTPVTTAAVLVPFDGKTGLAAYPDDAGMFAFKVPSGVGEVRIQDLGREPTTVSLATAPLNVTLKPAAGIRFDITDADGRSMPCKAHFEPLSANAAPLDLGPKERAHGCVDQYHSEKGQFTVQLPPGKYRVYVVRGPEYDHIEREVEVPAGGQVEFKGKLTRVVDTAGWISM
ncbi:MAG TPA: hypothetical protein VD994_13300, partial [Prosthecobacter sp.]|nr:hypothetical protein [Prosthecobacter sp.]